MLGQQAAEPVDELSGAGATAWLRTHPIGLCSQGGWRWGSCATRLYGCNYTVDPKILLDRHLRKILGPGTAAQIVYIVRIALLRLHEPPDKSDAAENSYRIERTSAGSNTDRARATAKCPMTFLSCRWRIGRLILAAQCT